jgi:hypothetical protein
MLRQLLQIVMFKHILSVWQQNGNSIVHSLKNCINRGIGDTEK